MARKKVEEVFEEEVSVTPMQPKFRTPLHNNRDDHQRVCSNVGTPVHLLYAPVYDSRGKFHLEVKGKENIYDFIQSFKDSVNINVILKRYMMGDTAALNRRQAMFIDTIDMPKSYAELLNAVIGAQEVFESLPIEQREEFNHSFPEFLASLDDGDVFDRMNNALQSKNLDDPKGVDPIES